MKITDHEEKKLIEQIILKNKFIGNGSVKILNELKSCNIDGINRVEIDKHFQNEMNGACFKSELDRLKASFANGLDGAEIVLPAYDDDSASAAKEEIESYLKSKVGFVDDNECTSLIEIYSMATGLLQGNIKAHREGLVSLKMDYLKYLKEIRSIIDTLS